MCLETVSVIHDPPLEETMQAWKIFLKFNDGSLESLFMYDKYETDRKYVATQQIIQEYNQDVRYPSGFHAFYTEEDAIKFRDSLYSQRECVFNNEITAICKISINGIVCEGFQHGIKVIVARDMIIH